MSKELNSEIAIVIECRRLNDEQLLARYSSAALETGAKEIAFFVECLRAERKAVRDVEWHDSSDHCLQVKRDKDRDQTLFIASHFTIWLLRSIWYLPEDLRHLDFLLSRVEPTRHKDYADAIKAKIQVKEASAAIETLLISV